jgi:hypothetical protein
MKTSATAPFISTLRNYRKVVVAVTALGSVPPILDIVMNVGPPWPTRVGVAGFTTLVVWVVLLVAYAGWKHQTLKRLRGRVTSLGAIAIVLLFAYITCRAWFVFDTGNARHQDVAGFVLQKRIVTLMELDRTKSIQDILEGAHFNPLSVWEPWTVSAARSLVLSTWILFFGCISMMTAVFVLMLEGEAAKNGKP